MTGFLCAFNRSGAPVDREICADRLDSVRDVGPDGTWLSFRKSWLAMGECVRRDTPEVPVEPRASQSNDCILAGDIRLDNRDELLAMLGKKGAALSDSDLLLEAYCTWGTGCIDRLVGEFSFVLWDDSENRLFAVRDPMGDRALYFARIGSQLVLSNEIRIMRNWPGISGQLDELSVASALVRRGMFMRYLDRTFFEGVEQLPPGHFLIATKDDIRTQRYWSITGLEENPLPRASRDDLLDEFRAIFTDAVTSRVRSVRPVGCHLSGGLDSTSVACIAAAELQKSGETLHCFSHGTRESIPDISATRTVREEAFIQATADRFANIQSHWAYGDERGLLSDVVTQFHYNGTVHPNHYQTWWDEISAKAAGLGLGTMLTGTSGNLTASWIGPSRKVSPYRMLRTKLRGLVAPILDPVIPEQFSSLRPEIVERIGVRDRIRQVASDLRVAPRAASLGRGMNGLYRSYAMGRFGIELRDPMGDKRVIEFCLRAPVDLFQRGGERRLLIRDSMRGMVPDVVLDRRSRQLQAADWVERTKAERPLLLDKLQRLSKSDAVNQFLDLTSVRSQLETLPVDRANMRSLGTWNDKVLHPMAIGCILEWMEKGCPVPQKGPDQA